MSDLKPTTIREAALRAFQRWYIYAVDLDGPGEHHTDAFMDRFDEEAKALPRPDAAREREAVVAFLTERGRSLLRSARRTADEPTYYRGETYVAAAAAIESLAHHPHAPETTEREPADTRIRELEAEVERLRDGEFRRFLSWRGIDGKPCPSCGAAGQKVYSSTATWHGGIAGQRMTPGICDKCWGSGDSERPWANLRTIHSHRRTAMARAAAAEALLGEVAAHLCEVEVGCSADGWDRLLHEDPQQWFKEARALLTRLRAHLKETKQA